MYALLETLIGVPPEGFEPYAYIASLVIGVYLISYVLHFIFGSIVSAFHGRR